MKRFITVPAALIFAVCAVSLAFAAPDRVPFTIRDDFETNEHYGWESYPYAQDIGYEPFTIPQKEPAHNDSKYALANIKKPNDMIDVAEGFTKEIDLWTVAGTRLKAAIFLTADRKPEYLELSLGLFDGSRYFHVIKSPKVNRWLELDIPMSGFAAKGKPLAAGAQVQVITIKAFYPVATHLASYTISLDDFVLNGERQRRFTATEPRSTDFEMFGYSILNRHFGYGDVIALTVKPENAPGKGVLTAVTAEVIDGAGKTVASGVKLQSRDGAWAGDNLYTVKKTDARGQWRVDLAGKDAAGNEVRWGFRFLMPGEKLTPQRHPRLHFTAEELKKRLASQSPIEAKILQSALSNPASLNNIDLSGVNEAKNLQTESLTGGPYSVISVYDNWRAPQVRLSGVIEAGAWLYAIKGDEAAGRKAKEALLKLCAFTRWNHPWQDAHGNHTYFPMGYTIGPVATGYDLLYPLLSEAERKAVRDGLMEKGIKPFYRDMVEMNRMPSSLSNHIAVLVANLSLAATAICGDDRANPSLEPYFSGILAKMKRFMDRTFYSDGGYGEPLTYQDMATRDLVEALDVLEENIGIDYALETNLKESWRYPLYVTYNNGRYPDFGDVSPSYGLSGLSFMYYTWKLKNPYTYNFVQKAFEAGRGGIPAWQWYVNDITPKRREELVPSHHFPIKGHLVSRSDWSDEGVVNVFKCGPNSNHYHYDQGTFYLMTNGEELLSDAGHGSSYYANLHYACYYTQTIGHNCMLVDGNAESQAPADYLNGIAALQDWPRIQHAFAGRVADEVEGDLTCVYKGTMENYTRSLLYLKPDLMFLYDRVKSAKPHLYDWIFHAEHTNGRNSISMSGNTVTIARTKARLRMDVLAPELASNTIEDSDRDESFITLRGKPGTKDTEFLAVLTPRAVKSPADTVIASTSTLLGANGWTGAKVERPDGVTVACFRTAAGPGAGTVEGFSADAERFAVSADKSGKTALLFVRGTSLTRQGSALFKSSRPLSAAASFGATETLLETESDAPAEVALALAKAPATVTLNGAMVASGWKYDAGTKMLSVSVKDGRTEVRIK
ncbi:MAG: heparinase II/III domain-containing protein [Candidatus Latescibacterota bacterium]